MYRSKARSRLSGATAESMARRLMAPWVPSNSMAVLVLIDAFSEAISFGASVLLASFFRKRSVGIYICALVSLFRPWFSSHPHFKV